MAAELVTPIDELTSLSLPVMSPLELLEHAHFGELSRHHGNHPGSAEQLQSIGGKALRSSVIQLLPPSQHNFGKGSYHTYYTGPKLPEAGDGAGQLRRVLFAVAGYIPDRVIDLSACGPTVRHATPIEREALHTTRADGSYYYFRYGYEPVRNFCIERVARPEVLDMCRSALGNFLAASDELTRTNLGMTIAQRVTKVVTSDIATPYQRLHRGGSLDPNSPPEPDALVARLLNSPSGRVALLAQLEQAARQKLDQQG